MSWGRVLPTNRGQEEASHRETCIFKVKLSSFPLQLFICRVQRDSQVLEISPSHGLLHPPCLVSSENAKTLQLQVRLPSFYPASTLMVQASLRTIRTNFIMPFITVHVFITGNPGHPAHPSSLNFCLIFPEKNKTVRWLWQVLLLYPPHYATLFSSFSVIPLN